MKFYFGYVIIYTQNQYFRLSCIYCRETYSGGDALIRNPDALPQSTDAVAALHQMLKLLIEEKFNGSYDNESNEEAGISGR